MRACVRGVVFKNPKLRPWPSSASYVPQSTIRVYLYIFLYENCGRNIIRKKILTVKNTKRDIKTIIWIIRETVGQTTKNQIKKTS